MTSWLHPNKPEPAWSLSAIAPIPGRPLLAHVQDLLPPSGRGPLPGGGEPLPDEPLRDPAKLRFGGGSLDGIMSVRGARSDGNESLAAASAVISLTRKTLPSTKEVDVRHSGPGSWPAAGSPPHRIRTIVSGGRFSAAQAYTSKAGNAVSEVPAPDPDRARSHWAGQQPTAPTRLRLLHGLRL
jgi:hypothetical protein